MLTGVGPGERVVVASSFGFGPSTWGASVEYHVGSRGAVDFSRAHPASGDFDVADPMAFIWAATPGSLVDRRDAMPEDLVLVATRDGEEIARLVIGRTFLPGVTRPEYIYTRERIGYLYPPVSGSGEPAPAVIVLGGSEGGVNPYDLVSTRLAAHGYAVLNLAYFGGVGWLPRTLERIPLEYFVEAVAWLREQPMVDAGRIGVIGYSRCCSACTSRISRRW